ncbi:membrane progestin receptor alpha-like [Branchiostoma floridae x Branchiostoma belcheri]
MATKQRLLTIDEAPVVQRDTFVLTGYRPPYQPWRFYLMSIFSVHNETVNIWTQLIPCLYVLYMLKTFCEETDVTGDVSSRLLLLLTVSNFTAQFLSACAHLLHSRSIAAYYVGFMMDYLGIAFFASSCGTVQYFLSSEATFFHSAHPWFPWVCVLVTCCYFAANSYSHITYKKGDVERVTIQAVSFSSTYLWVTSPIMHRVYSDICTGNADDVTWMHGRHILLVAMAGFFHASEVPQRFLPGSCDVIGHGHQIWHVLTSASFVTQLQASFTDLQNRRHLGLVRIHPVDLSLTAYLVVMFTSYGYLTAIFVRKALSKAM